MPSPFDLTGKVALVTGGNNGIGLGMARGLVDAGASVMIWGRNEGRNADATALLTDDGGHAMALAVDVGVEDEVVEAFAATVESLGHVDAVFANAGIGAGATPFGDMSTEEWRGIFRINMDGAFWT
jgi:NAD(P)-dependent dehydrogenase (short-subunit alcohol dehydrogenase family)